jgi:hypothetical protein
VFFKPEHVEPILSGRKTQTRRTGRKRWNIGAVHQLRLNYEKSGHFADARILRVWQERLGDISDADAWAEGYDSIPDYQEAFFRIYRVPDDPQAHYEALRLVLWCVEFEVVQPELER